MNTRDYTLKPSPLTPKLTAQLALPPESLTKYRRELNDAQWQAVTTTEGPLLVIAGAGTGKTKTLTYRVAYLVEAGIPSANILLLTFTRRAAQEMLRRAAAVGGEQAANIAGGTFHAYAHQALHQYGNAIGLSNQFTVLDQADSTDTVNYCRSDLGLPEKEKRFPTAATIAGMISAAANRQQPLEEVVGDDHPHFLEHLADIQRVAQFYDAYKRRNHLLDYDDLLLRLRDLLTEQPLIQRKIASQWRYVMTDEFQDTNIIQADLVRLLSRFHGNVMAVGDDAQSIFSFRGANYRNILDFPAQYAGCKIIKLEENYRSTQRILDVTNIVINQAREKFTKNLYTRRKPEGEYPALVPAADENMQSQFVAQRILELREEGVPLNEIAVLMRSGHNSFDLEIELQRRQIPFVKHGGQKLLEAAHIRDFLAFLKVIHNPRDLVSWMRLLLLHEGIGQKTAKNLTDQIQEAAEPYQVLKTQRSRTSGEALWLLGDLFQLITKTQRGLAELGDAIYTAYRPLLQAKYLQDYPRREQDMENFLALLVNFHSVEQLLTDLALDPIEHTSRQKPVEDDEAPLVLSTIHSAKGLEWHSVFLIHALEGVIPSSYALDDATTIDEELRLFYVALTRARYGLYICYPALMMRRGYDCYLTKPSRFLDGLPAEAYETWSLGAPIPSSYSPPHPSSQSLSSQPFPNILPAPGSVSGLEEQGLME